MNILLNALQSPEKFPQETVCAIVTDPEFDKNARDPEGRPAISLLIAKGYETAALYLIENGADVNAADKDKNTPLHYAQERGSQRVSIALMKAGCNYMAKNIEGLRADQIVLETVYSTPATVNVVQPPQRGNFRPCGISR